jgi:hypothetical protein
MKKVEDGFNSQEITCSLFTYTISEFKKLKAKKVVQEWDEDLNSNSSSHALYEGSPFDANGLALSTEIDEDPVDENVYVVPHYYYSTAEYSIEEQIDKKCIIKLAPILGRLIPGKPMDWAEKEGEPIYFEGVDASDGSEYAVNFYKGSTLIGEALLSEVDDALILSIVKKL